MAALEQPRPRRSIGPRLTLASAALVGICVALVLGLVYGWTVSAARRAMDDRVHEEVAELERHLAEGGRDALAIEIERRVRIVGGDGTVYLLLAEASRRVAGNLDAWPLGAQDGAGMHWFTLDAAGREAPPGDADEAGEAGEADGGQRVRVQVLDLPGGDRLLVGHSSRGHDRLRRRLRLAFGVGLGSALVLAIGAGLTLSHGLLARVKAMTDTVRRIRAGDREERVALGRRRDEFDELARSFNELLDENEDLVGQVRGIADDVAHDLRTPLARLRSRVEAALRAPRTGAEYVDSLETIRDELDGVLETFQALLAITEVEHATLGERAVRVPLAPLARDAVELYEPAAEEAGTTLAVDADESVAVRGDPQLLTQALTNLIDNALKYAAGGPVTVFARRVGARVELGVADRGPGIPADQRERALRRFARLDDSRRLPGTGLGLSFVAAVARAHGAELVLGDGDPGLVVRLVLASSD